MDNRASSGTQTAQAALLRPSIHQDLQPQGKKRQGEGGQGGDSRQSRERVRGHSPLASQHRLPVLETDQFRVVEPDGTEDPWASADDGLVPERQPPVPEQQRKKG